MSKADLFISLDHIAQAAKDARKNVDGAGLEPRMRRTVEALLNRLPEQVEDIKAACDDPHRRTEEVQRRASSGIIIPH